jgi:hypothetical protein
MGKKVALLTSLIFAIAFLVLGLMVACGGGSKTTTTQTQLASVNTSLSDPPTCGSAQGGQFAHIYISVRDVQIHASANASDNDPNWIDLTPSLKSGAPTQVDLLGLANNNCFLATLGSNTQIQPGSYQQIRVLLADNSATVATNNCGNAGNNCVVLNSDPTHPKPLQLSSEAQTGLKIPPGQIAGGQFVVGPGQTKDLNIDFNACASIVQQGNGQFRLKPVLHAGEVSLTAQSINGTIVNGTNSQPITGRVVVALEQKDTNGTDRVVMETVPDALGHFVFCPVPAGTYDVVAVAIDSNGNAFAPTVTTGLQPGNAAGNIPLFPQQAISQAAAIITGTITTSTGSAGTSADVSVSAAQQVASTLVTIPLATQSASAILLTTTTGSSCPTQTFCGTYALSVPAANATVGAFSTSGTTYTQNITNPVGYIVDALASVPSSGGKPNCAQPELTTNKLQDGIAPLNVFAGGTVTASVLSFTGCQ